jgi:hypothetical protein
VGSVFHLSNCSLVKAHTKLVCWTVVVLAVFGCKKATNGVAYAESDTALEPNQDSTLYRSDSTYAIEYPRADSVLEYTYSNDNISQGLKLGFQRGKPTWVNVVVGKPTGCTGEFQGVLVTEDAQRHTYVFGDYTCGQLQVVWSPGAVGIGKVKVEQVNEHIPCHGASCGFGGELSRTK